MPHCQPSESGEDAGQPVLKVATAEKKTKSLDNAKPSTRRGRATARMEPAAAPVELPSAWQRDRGTRQSRDDRVHAAAGLPKPRRTTTTRARALSAVYYNVPLPPMGTRTLRSDGSDGAMASFRWRCSRRRTNTDCLGPGVVFWTLSNFVKFRYGGILSQSERPYQPSGSIRVVQRRDFITRRN